MEQMGIREGGESVTMFIEDWKRRFPRPVLPATTPEVPDVQGVAIRELEKFCLNKSECTDCKYYRAWDKRSIKKKCFWELGKRPNEWREYV